MSGADARSGPGVPPFDAPDVAPESGPAGEGGAHGGKLPGGALLSTFLRSLTIQGSWNYRTMVGGGFAFALLPVLRALAASRKEPLAEAVQRHLEHFNAHPYLTSMALGATTRLELDGEDAETVRRFKAAIRGPLGGLGDTLVWAAWLPTVTLLALAAAWAGLTPWACVLLFLAVYNAGHLALRTWGFTAGLHSGKELGPVLRSAHLAPLAEWVTRAGSVLAGVVTGLILAGDPGLRDPAALWVPLALAAFATGVVGGHRVWRPAALVVVGAVGAVLLLQSLP